jgi:type I restriction enzyme S subunit
MFSSNVDKKSVEGQPAVKLCNYTDVYYNEEINERLDFMPATATQEQIEKFTLKAEDTLITKDSESPDDIAVPAFVPRTLPGVICGYHLAVIRPKSAMNGRFVSRLFQSSYVKAKCHVGANGLTRYGLSQSALNDLDLPVPPLLEQLQISSFLDQETSKIDALITEQQRLIELLKEKRQAVISHAVTKGLNPDVRMKPSGVEWLGEVPEHWKVRRLKFVCELLTSNVDKKTVEGEIPVRLCNYTDVYYNEQITENMEFMAASATAAQAEKFTLQRGDTIITKDSESPDDIAVPAYVPNSLPGIVCGYHLAVLRPRKELLGIFLSRLFKSGYIRGQCAVAANGLTRYGLSQSAIRDLQLPIPPVSEQEQIGRHLEEVTRQMDCLVEDVSQTIRLLQERRIALISAAVTGKIDVRNYASTQKDAA